MSDKRKIPQIRLSQYMDASGGVPVVVYSARTPYSIVVHPKCHVDELKAVEKTLTEMYSEVDSRYASDPRPRAVKKNRCYALYSPRKHRWVRVRAKENIEDVRAQAYEVEFELVDYATTESVLPARVRELSDGLCVLPAMGYSVGINEPSPCPLTSAHYAKFRHTVVGKTLCCRMRSRILTSNLNQSVALYAMDAYQRPTYQIRLLTILFSTLQDST